MMRSFVKQQKALPVTQKSDTSRHLASQSHFYTEPESDTGKNTINNKTHLNNNILLIFPFT